MKPCRRPPRHRLGRALRAFAWLVALLGPAGAQALCITTCSCTTTITNVVFAPYNPLSLGSDDSTGAVKVNCNGVTSLLVPFTISMSAGSSNNYAARNMTSGASRLVYNLYAASDYSSILGDATGGTLTLGGTITIDTHGVGTAQTFTVYGRIPAGQTTAPPGGYADTVVVTVSYL